MFERGTILPCRYIYVYTSFGHHVAAEIKAPSKFPLQCLATGRLAIAMPLDRQTVERQATPVFCLFQRLGPTHVSVRSP